MNVNACVCATLLAITAASLPAAASAGLIVTNNMSDAAVLMTAYDAAHPAKVIGTWCVGTGDYDQHTLNVVPALLRAAVTADGCKEPVLMNKTLQLSPDAATYRVTGSAGHYAISGPAHR